MNAKIEAPTIEGDENTSGMGKFQELPGGVEGWSWGAFFFAWLWAIPNRTWIGFAPLIPFTLAFVLAPLGAAGGFGAGLLILSAVLLAFAMHFMLGFNGRKWAWQNRRWNDLAHFQRVQRYWSIAALTLMGLTMLAIGSSIVQGLRAERESAASAGKLSSSINEARQAASHLGDYMKKHHSKPAQLEDAGVVPPYGDDIAELNLLPNGQLHVTPKEWSGRGFILAPSFNDRQQVEWRCLAGDIPRMEMPPECRYDVVPELRFP